MTKSVGCHKRAKPGGEREEKGGWEEEGRWWWWGEAVEKRGCKGRQLDPSGPDNAEWKTDDCGERGGEEGWSVDLLGYLGGYTVCLSVPYQPPTYPLFLFTTASLHFCLPKSTLATVCCPRKEQKRAGGNKGGSVPFSLAFFLFLSFLRTSLIPRWVPSFITAYHLCIILYRTLPINIIRAARST